MEFSPAEFDELLRQFELKGSADDVRTRPRVMIRRGLTIVTDPDDPSRPVADVVLQDISPGGLSLTHHTAMPPGKKFQVLLPSAHGPRKVNCTVRHCTMVKQHLFRIGARF